MLPLKLFPQKTEFGFVQFRNIAFGLSSILLIGSVVLFFTTGLNFGIDFKGGTEIEVETQGAADLGKIRSIVGTLNLGDVQIKEFGEANTVQIVVELQSGGDDEAAVKAQQEVVEKIKSALDSEYGTPLTYLSISQIGGKVSGELTRSGTLAVITAVILMLGYIWFRFEWQFAVGAVLALAHDVILTIGMFSITQLDFTLAIIAAILTIVGYSMNDTVVVYDRVRENLRKFKRMPLDNLLDLSINDTLARTVMTSVTTLLALFSLYILGGEVIRGFTFAMIWGIFVGTYSSIFVAAPFLLFTNVKRDWSGLEKTDDKTSANSEKSTNTAAKTS